jgi:hypothetical protein
MGFATRFWLEGNVYQSGNRIQYLCRRTIEILQASPGISYNAKENVVVEPYVMVGDMKHILDSLNLVRHLFQRFEV